MSRARAFTLLSCLLYFPAHAQLVDSQVVFDTDTVFPIINEAPTTYGGDVAIDDEGNVATRGRWSGGTAVVARINGELVTIAATGITQLPGSTDLIDQIDDHIEIVDGRVVFFVRNTVGNTDDELIAFGDGNSITVMVQVGVDDVPGQPAGTKFDNLDSSEGFGYDGRRLAFKGRFGSSGGVYLWEDGALSEIVTRSDTVDGMTVTSERAPMPDSDGPGVVTRLTLDGSGNATYYWEDGVFTRIIGVGDAMPSGPGTVDNVGDSEINAGRVLLSVNNAADFESLILWDGDNIEVIADSDTQLPESQPPLVFRDNGLAGPTAAVNVRWDGNSRQGIYVLQEGSIIAQASAGEDFDSASSSIANQGSFPLAILGEDFDGANVAEIGVIGRPFVGNGWVGLNIGRDDDSEEIYAIRVLRSPTDSPGSEAPQKIPSMGSLQLGALILVLLAIGLVGMRRL